MDNENQQKYLNAIFSPSPMEQMQHQKWWDKLSSAQRAALYHSVLPAVVQGVEGDEAKILHRIKRKEDESGGEILVVVHSSPYAVHNKNLKDITAEELLK